MSEVQHPQPLARSGVVEDAELSARAAAGDRAAFGRLVERYAGQARRLARAVLGNVEDADDAAQDGFLAALKSIDRYDPTRPFGPWLHRIVVNRAIDWARARALRREVGDEQLAVVPAREEAPAEDLSNQIMTALAGLSPDHRAVVVLRYVLDYSPGEIAELLELPRGTVNSRLRRGLDALQEHVMREQP